MKSEIIKTINVVFLLESLSHLYDMGVDYIDISSETDEEGQAIILQFSKDYLHPNMRDNFEEQMKKIEEDTKDDQIKIKLTDKDIDDSI